MHLLQKDLNEEDDLSMPSSWSEDNLDFATSKYKVPIATEYPNLHL